MVNFLTFQKNGSGSHSEEGALSEGSNWAQGWKRKLLKGCTLGKVNQQLKVNY